MKNALSIDAARSKATFSTALSNALGPLIERAGPAPVNVISPALIPDAWRDVDYRRAAMEATVENLIAWQIRINREERGLTQAQLASQMGTGQPAISKLEDTEGGDLQLSTLIKAAHAFDCALLVKFIEYEHFAAATRDVRPERLFACGFAQTHQALDSPKKRVRTRRTSEARI